jgi:hypothetical protein
MRTQLAYLFARMCQSATGTTECPPSRSQEASTRRGRGNEPQNGVCFYLMRTTGRQFCVNSNESTEYRRRYNDRISSIRILTAQVTVYDNENFNGS